MTDAQLGSVLILLAFVVALSHVLAHLCERLRQPRLVGEILAGVLLGPFVLGQLAPRVAALMFGDASPDGTTRVVVGFVDELGLLLLMLVAGAGAKGVLVPENRRPTAWILAVGTPLPFALAFAAGMVLPVEPLMGPAQHRLAVVLVLATAVAVTSIPVITRIFHDLGILHTRFAGLVLGAAILEDIALWAVLAVATALASTAETGRLAGHLTAHIGTTVAFMAVCLVMAPVALRRLHRARWNALATSAPVAYVLLILLAYAGFAAVLQVNLVFAAFLAGFGLVGGIRGADRDLFAEPVAALSKVAFALFIPVYFFMVGYRLELGRGFSAPLLLLFLVGSSALCLVSIGLAARLAGFRGLDIVNLAVASNARGGPGIVLASVAYEAGIISGSFFTTLVLTAILTSQAAGLWLGWVLRRGWPLLSSAADSEAGRIDPP